MLKIYMDLKTNEVGIVGGWTILLNGMVSPSILMAPIPGASWPFCCQAVVQDTMHLPKLAGSDRYDIYSGLQYCREITPWQWLTTSGLGSRDVCCICGCNRSRNLRTPESAIASVVTVITTWNSVGWILRIPILMNHHFSNPGGRSLHPNNLSHLTLWPHHYCTK